MRIYTNGVLMGSSSVTISMAGVIAVLNKVGADNWPDPGMQGSVDELRIYNGVLEPDNVQMDYAAGPDQLPAPKVTLAASLAQGAVTLSWPGSATGLRPVSSQPLGRIVDDAHFSYPATGQRQVAGHPAGVRRGPVLPIGPIAGSAELAAGIEEAGE